MMPPFRLTKTFLPIVVTLLLSLALSACGNSRYVSEDEYNDPRYRGAASGNLFGDTGIVLGVGGKQGGASGSNDGAALGVNAYLWRGALDTLGFMPLASADPFGGVIITDWYEPPATPGERFKATAFILGRQLRADGLRISIFRQVLQGGRWIDTSVSQVTISEIENKVLSRARELRAQTARG
ncbi:MAG: DUF3576 domain-containing protein [Acetobacteraceae bacterium]|nr:DUF3576 domain-containing protein [Acetobacteraceae bacterium]